MALETFVVLDLFRYGDHTPSPAPAPRNKVRSTDSYGTIAPTATPSDLEAQTPKQTRKDSIRNDGFGAIFIGIVVGFIIVLIWGFYTSSQDPPSAGEGLMNGE
jgi:hypothetical protein